MQRSAISPDDLLVRPVHLWSERWFLLTAGDFDSGRFNCMTVAWGSLGVMWNRPFAQVVVRPTRHTHGFIERYPSFTLCAFSPAHRQALVHLGTTSGRDGDKLTGCGLTAVTSTKVSAPSFAEAELILECRTIYRNQFDPAHFIDPAIDEEYPKKDYHTSYFGEIVAAWGIPAFQITETAQAAPRA